jgi:hypothetical protein
MWESKLVFDVILTSSYRSSASVAGDWLLRSLRRAGGGEARCVGIAGARELCLRLPV